MFPEYRDLISRLKSENPRFLSLSKSTTTLIMKLPGWKVPMVGDTISTSFG